MECIALRKNTPERAVAAGERARSVRKGNVAGRNARRAKV